MELRPLGRTGMQVPVVGMGTWKTFDVKGSAAERERRAIVDRAVTHGTTLFDTSPMYGASELVLAKALVGRRENVIVADKVWTESATEGRAQVARALEWYAGSVDIYQVHNLVAWEEHLPLLEDLQAKGAVRVVGATHYQDPALADLMRVMETGRLGMIQIPYNALHRIVETDVLPLAAELGLGVLVMQPLGKGKLAAHSPPPDALRRLDQFNVRTWAQALLKWILSDPRVHCVIPATSKANRAEENALAGDPPWFDEETRAYVASLATARA
ncbi:MAG TPA: aldo/keto reductase [Gemmatimonadaceae bacterium]|nr:aldo/keto reductase [Gemmatimonadaceae bacterium]